MIYFFLQIQFAKDATISQPFSTKSAGEFNCSVLLKGKQSGGEIWQLPAAENAVSIYQ